MVHLDACCDGPPAALVSDLLDRLTILTAGVVPDEVRYVVVGPYCHVTGQGQRHSQDAAFHHLGRGDVGHALDQQESGLDLKVVPLVAELLQVRTKTYRSLRH